MDTNESIYGFTDLPEPEPDAEPERFLPPDEQKEVEQAFRQMDDQFGPESSESGPFAQPSQEERPPSHAGPEGRRLEQVFDVAAPMDVRGFLDMMVVLREILETLKDVKNILGMRP